MWFNNPGTPHSLFRMNFFSNKNWMIFFYKKNLFEEINLEGLSSFARIWIQNSYILLLWSREEEMLLISSNYQLEHGFLIDLLLEVALQIIIHFCSPRQCQILLLLMACWIYLIVLFLQKKKKTIIFGPSPQNRKSTMPYLVLVPPKLLDQMVSLLCSTKNTGVLSRMWYFEIFGISLRKSSPQRTKSYFHCSSSQTVGSILCQPFQTHKPLQHNLQNYIQNPCKQVQKLTPSFYLSLLIYFCPF